MAFNSSMSLGEIILEYVCPGLGVIVCQFMWTAPLKAVQNAREKGTLGDLNPTPWAVMTGNCVGWISYSFLIKNLFVFFGNATGFIISLWLNMNASKLLYHEYVLLNNPNSNSAELKTEVESSSTLTTRTIGGPYEDKDMSQSPLPMTTSNTKRNESRHEILFVTIATLWTILYLLIIFIPNISLKQRQMTVGIAVNCNLIFFYGAPLSTIFQVLKTKNSSSIHRRTMITNTVNGIFWTAYGIYKFDLFIAVPNGLGALLGFVQGLLCLFFPRRISITTVDQQHQQEKIIDYDNNSKDVVDIVEIAAQG